MEHHLAILGSVLCVSEDMTGEYGFCSYFKEFDHDLQEDERLTYAKNELPPSYDPLVQPKPPAAKWDEARLAKAYRNYAVEFVRNGVSTLTETLGREQEMKRGILAARPTGLQQYKHLASSVGAKDGDVEDAVSLLGAVFKGMGDEVEIDITMGRATIRHMGLRIVRGMEGNARSDLLQCWITIWQAPSLCIVRLWI